MNVTIENLAPCKKLLRVEIETGYPDIEEIQFGRGQALQFAATVETAPDFQLPEYKGLPVKRETTSVADEDVDRALNLLRERQISFQTVDRPAASGDVAVVNYTGTCDGKPITDTAPTAKGLTEQKNFWINIEPGAFIPGFADQLTGAKAGDKRTVNVDFPADFVTPQLAGLKGVFEVEVVEVKEKVLPPLDEAFAKAYGAESVETLRAGVRTDLENELNYNLLGGQRQRQKPGQGGFPAAKDRREGGHQGFAGRGRPPRHASGRHVSDSAGQVREGFAEAQRHH